MDLHVAFHTRLPLNIFMTPFAMASAVAYTVYCHFCLFLCALCNFGISLTFVLYSAIYFLMSLAKVFSLPQHIF